MQKSEKSLLRLSLIFNDLREIAQARFAQLPGIQQLTQTKKLPLSGELVGNPKPTYELTDLLKVLSAQVARRICLRATLRFEPFMSENIT